jgi:hypothetical protein
MESKARRERAWVCAKVEVQPHDEGRALKAIAAIASGERLIALSHVFVDEPCKYSIQLDEGRHQAGTEEADDFLNHACDPSAALDFGALEVFALRPIAAGELITFDYNTSEWDMHEPFACLCGSPRCLGEIRGFRYLTQEQRERIEPRLSPFLRRRLLAGREREAG